MNKTSFIYSMMRVAGCVVLAGMLFPSTLFATPRTGEAVVAGKVGTAQARVFTGPVHEGRTEVIDLNEGSSIGETSRMITGKDGRLCVVLSPGAILCVAPETELTFSQLRHSADGLPESEDDLIRRIYIELHKGRILVHAGAPTPSFDMKINVDAGSVEASGGTFVVAQNGKSEWAVISEEHEQTLIPKNGKKSIIVSGNAAMLSIDANGNGLVDDEKSLLESPLRKFEICNTFFQDLETFTEDPIKFDRQGLGEYLGASKSSSYFGYDGAVSDVSPSFRPVTAANIQSPAPIAGEPGSGERWNNRRIWAWYDDVGVIKGVNYIPRNAVNSTEMWMEETFDEDIIDEELGWAKKAGFTAVRVQLQYIVWQTDPEGFIERLGKFLDLAHRNDLRVVPVLFDDLNLAGTDPTYGPQPDPIPGKHNGRWTPSPGPSMVKNRSYWPELRKYIKGVISEFKHNDHVLYWDLYSTAGNDNLWEESLPLLDQTFKWAREVDPSQPLAVAAWSRFGSAMSVRKLERSDIITFQSFESPEEVEAILMLLRRYERPIICADWMMRQQDNTFAEMLPIFAANRVGWFSDGLAEGRTQKCIQLADYISKKDPSICQHNILDSQGKAYDPNEIELIQSFRFLEGL